MAHVGLPATGDILNFTSGKAVRLYDDISVLTQFYD
jgi:hypothetical protein